MPQFELTPEEQQQADDSPIRFRNDPPFDTFSLREDTRWAFPVGSTEFSNHAGSWINSHLVALRVKPLVELALDRVLPETFLPSPNDPQLVACFDEIELAFSAEPETKAGSVFLPLLTAIWASRDGQTGFVSVHEEETLGARVMRELLCASLSVASALVDPALRTGWRLVARSDPSLLLEWNMGGCKTRFFGRLHAFLVLENAEGNNGGVPVVLTTKPWDPRATTLAYALGAAVANVRSVYRNQEIFILDFETPAKVSFASVFFTEEYLRKVLDNSPPAALPTTYLRCSSFNDLSTPEGLKEAMRGMLGLLRYLLSGEAEVARMQLGLRT